MRSFLFVPGDSERKLEKSLGSGADALILDLEDSVSAERKETARKLVAEFLGAAAGSEALPALWVRINSFDTRYWDADLKAAMTATTAGIVLPKTASGADVTRLAAVVSHLEAEHDLKRGETRILPIATEVPVSLLQMHTYLDASPRMTAMSWGAEDLSAELGAQATRDNSGRLTSPYQLARNLCLMTAVACGAQPIDTVFINFRDEDGLRTECEEAVRDGFAGKLAIHPAQVAVINDVFTPTTEQVAWAEKVVAALKDNPSGVASIDGAMVDRPHLRRAETILSHANIAGNAVA